MSRFKVPFRMHRSGWLIPAFCLILGVEIAGWRLALPIGAVLVASLLLHEVGHMLAATLLWVPVREFGMRFGGAYTRRAYATRRRDEILISAAGPLMNIAIAFPLIFVPHYGSQLAMCNLMLGAINLLPIPSSDGLRILKTLLRSGPPIQMASTLKA
jgi:Zn-dependent protease